MLKTLTAWVTIKCRKFFKRWEFQATWPASCETCMQVKRQQLEPDMKQWSIWFKIGKGVCQDCILSTCLFNLFADLEKEMKIHFSILTWRIPWTEESCRLQSMGSQRVGHKMRGWMMHKLESRLPGGNINKLRYACRYQPNNRYLRETKESPDEGERREWKIWLKTQHSKNENHSL